MARPSKLFPPGFEANARFLGNGEDVEDLDLWRGTREDGVPIMIIPWQLSMEELGEVNRTGHIYVEIQGTQLAPLFLTTGLDFDNGDDNADNENHSLQS